MQLLLGPFPLVHSKSDQSVSPSASVCLSLRDFMCVVVTLLLVSRHLLERQDATGIRVSIERALLFANPGAGSAGKRCRGGFHLAKACLLLLFFSPGASAVWCEPERCSHVVPHFGSVWILHAASLLLLVCLGAVLPFCFRFARSRVVQVRRRKTFSVLSGDRRRWKVALALCLLPPMQWH